MARHTICCVQQYVGRHHAANRSSGDRRSGRTRRHLLNMSPGDGTEGPMSGQRSTRLDPGRAGEAGRRRPERGRRSLARHRRHRPGVECLEGRQLLSAITEFPLRKPLPNTGSGTGDLTVGPDGNLWFGEDSFEYDGVVIRSAIGRITPAGALTQFPLPAADVSLSRLTVGPDGNLWFTAYGSNNRATRPDRPDHAGGRPHRVPAPGGPGLRRRLDGRPRRQPLVPRVESRPARMTSAGSRRRAPSPSSRSRPA